MKLIATTQPNLEQKAFILALWNQEYPRSLAYEDLQGLENYLAGLQDARHLFLEIYGERIGWYLDFIRDGEKWFAMILKGSHHGQGFGRRILEHVKAEKETLNGWVVDKEGMEKEDGTMYISPLGFYRKNGFQVLENERLEIPVLSAVKIRWSAEME